MTITLTYGLPASGKSTWAKEQAANSDGQIVRINMDDIRSMLNLPYSTKNENLAQKLQVELLVAAVKAGKDVILDNTHITDKMPKAYKKAIDGSARFEVKDFTDVSLTECLYRDKRRPNPVGDAVIKRMHNQLKSGKFVLTEEWLNDVKISPLYVPRVSAAAAIVVDIDGTLAEHVARSPYDYSRVLTDAVHEHIAELVRMYRDYGYYILIVSGREDSCREDTKTWLKTHNIPYDALFMRETGDKRDDRDVKQDIFDTYIRDLYQVSVWIDDRKRVVDRMRALGIKVLQVAPGDF